MRETKAVASLLAKAALLRSNGQISHVNRIESHASCGLVCHVDNLQLKAVEMIGEKR